MLRVCLRLAHWADFQTGCDARPAVATLASALSMTDRGVRKVLDRAVTAGFLRETRRKTKHGADAATSYDCLWYQWDSDATLNGCSDYTAVQSHPEQRFSPTLNSGSVSYPEQRFSQSDSHSSETKNNTASPAPDPDDNWALTATPNPTLNGCSDYTAVQGSDPATPAELRPYQLGLTTPKPEKPARPINAMFAKAMRVAAIWNEMMRDQPEAKADATNHRVLAAALEQLQEDGLRELLAWAHADDWHSGRKRVKPIRAWLARENLEAVIKERENRAKAQQPSTSETWRNDKTYEEL